MYDNQNKARRRFGASATRAASRPRSGHRLGPGGSGPCAASRTVPRPCAAAVRSGAGQALGAQNRARSTRGRGARTRMGARTGVSPAATGLIHGGLESTYLRHGRCWVTSHPSPSPRDWLAVTLPTTATPASPSSLPGCPAARPAVGVQTAGLVSQRSFLLSSPVPRSPVPFLPGEPFSTAFCPPPLSQATHEAQESPPRPPPALGSSRGRRRGLPGPRPLSSALGEPQRGAGHSVRRVGRAQWTPRLGRGD